MNWFDPTEVEFLAETMLINKNTARFKCQRAADKKITLSVRQQPAGALTTWHQRQGQDESATAEHLGNGRCIRVLRVA